MKSFCLWAAHLDAVMAIVDLGRQRLIGRSKAYLQWTPIQPERLKPG